MYLWFTDNTCLATSDSSTVVVICFQNVSLIYWQHLKFDKELNFLSCDLLSKCIFDLLTTPASQTVPTTRLLWFAFKMYLWFTDNTRNCSCNKKSWVVICFQNVSLIYWQHQGRQLPIPLQSCDLLSKCIFDLLTTPPCLDIAPAWALWFAFKMYLWFTDNTTSNMANKNYIVVICFQNVSLIYWQHLCQIQLSSLLRCDLLSKCIFDLLTTPLITERIS